MFKRIDCLFRGHQWLLGKPASSEAVAEVRKLGWTNYHNRVCANCEKKELHADKAEARYHRHQLLKARMSPYELGVDVDDLDLDSAE